MDLVSTRTTELCDGRSASLPFDVYVVVFDTQTDRYTGMDYLATYMAIRIGTRWQEFAPWCGPNKSGRIVDGPVSIVLESDTDIGRMWIDGVSCWIVLFPKMAQKTNLLGKSGLVV